MFGLTSHFMDKCMSGDAINCLLQVNIYFHSGSDYVQQGCGALF